MVNYVNVCSLIKRMKQENWGDVLEANCANPVYINVINIFKIKIRIKHNARGNPG